MKQSLAIPQPDPDPGPWADSIGPLELLVLQATPFCNLDCSYCYLPDRDNPRKMDLAVIEMAISRILEAGLVDREFTVVWHAGEPLVLGTDYYERALRAIAALLPGGIAVTHSFQTNAVLVDQDWCEFFKRHRVRLGVSVDGPARFHDRFRKTRSGKGTHHRVTRALELLRAESVPFHVIAVITDEALGYADEMFHYFNGLGIDNLCLNIEEIEGCNRESALLHNDRYRAYKSFLRRIHELREIHNPGLIVREIDGAISAVTHWRKGGPADWLKPQENNPFKILNVGAGGDFSTFSPELLGTVDPVYGNFSLGNLFDTSVAQCLCTAHYRAIAAAVKAGKQACRNECDYFELCGGGSPSNKLAENARLDSTETAFCRLQKKACIDLALELLERRLGIA